MDATEILSKFILSFDLCRRQQRVRQRAQQNAIESEHASVSEVNPEFLAALPPNIQEEVLAQQRMEQRRQAAIATNPEDPVDPAEFFQNLQPSLRQQILADMEDSQISVLPPELAAEAQNLRRELETRNRANMQPQSQIGNVQSYSSVLRYRSRLPEPIFTQSLQPMRFTNWGCTNSSDNGPSLMTMMERQGRRLLDHESLASLLILMFLDEQKFNSNRLQRVIRNLCYHVPTRDWIINALLSIIERSNESTENPTSPDVLHVASRPLWLNIRLDAALGARNNVFIIKRDRDAISDVDGVNYEITIHVQAAQIICRHALDLLILLSKSFPVNFLPRKSTNKTKKTEQMETSSNAKAGPSSLTTQAGPSTSRTETQQISKRKSTDFWDILMHLESTAQQRKFNPGNCPKMNEIQREFVEPESTSFSDSPFGQLVSMLSFSIVKKSSQLTDKLLRLLSFISVGLPENKDSPSTENAASNSRTGDSARQATDSNVTKPSEASNQQTEQENSENIDEIDESILPESETHLRLAIDVLTSKSCSEEGLEDATLLLLNLSQCSNRTRTLIIELLISGATYLAKIVKQQIKDLMNDLQLLNRTNKVHAVAQTLLSSSIQEPEQEQSSKSVTPKGGASASPAAKGILQDRFTKETVVITAPNKQKTTCELQLPSMVPLISKTSSQSFFLRTLKVIIQIREAVREAIDKENSTISASAPNTGSNAGRAASSSSSTTTTAASSAKSTHRPKIVLSPGELSSLSDILQLDELWDTLSTCLIELEATADHHAVLILQPAVEAFFLVHATQQSKSATGNTATNATETPQLVPQPFSAPSNDPAPVDTPSVEPNQLQSNPAVSSESTTESAPVQPMQTTDAPQVIYKETVYNFYIPLISTNF